MNEITVTVYHRNPPRFEDAACLDFEQLQKVATITVAAERGVDEALDVAWDMTQSINAPWFAPVRCAPMLRAEPGRHRSSSVGDVLSVVTPDSATWHYVAPCGFALQPEPRATVYASRVRQLEDLGLSTSDAQGAAEAEGLSE